MKWGNNKRISFTNFVTPNICHPTFLLALFHTRKKKKKTNNNRRQSIPRKWKKKFLKKKRERDGRKNREKAKEMKTSSPVLYHTIEVSFWRKSNLSFFAEQFNILNSFSLYLVHIYTFHRVYIITNTFRFIGRYRPKKIFLEIKNIFKKIEAKITCLFSPL